MDTVNCTVERITYHNDENGYSVIKVKVKEYNDLVTAIGYIDSINIGSVLKLHGDWKVDKKYGRQLNIIKWEETLPATINGIEKYLGSGLIKGVGSVYAKKIVNMFKENTLEIIDNEPDKLIEVDGIGKKRVETIKKAWKEQKEIKNVMIFLQENGVSTKYALKIFKAYGNNSIEVVKKNPYQLADDIWGIGFKISDTIASKLGIEKESYIRCRSGILYTLSELSNEGHCYATMTQLVETAVKLLEIEESKIAITIDYMCQIKEIIAEDKDSTNNIYNRLYLPPLYFSEIGVSKLIKNILVTPSLKNIKTHKLNTKIEYDDIQRQSIQSAASSKFMVLTGGPGTGKTTTTLGIIDLFKNNGFDVILAAPTGRAAKRMSEAAGLEAKTIHRLLEFKPPQGYQINDKNQLKGDVLIIDETSMIDIVLMYNLLKAVPQHMIVILIGDINQLPSIGSGNVFHDIIESKIVEVVKLEKIYRQASDSDIIKTAHKINRGYSLDLKNKKNSDFFFIEHEDDSSIAPVIAELYSKRLPKHYKVNPLTDIQVLCPMQRGVSGTLNMNITLQNSLNKNTLSIKHGGIEFRLNDKVMQLKNNYNKEIFNGDMGLITKVNLDDLIITVDFDGKQVEYETNELDELSLAYAVTIHKSQGSEYSIVIMPVTMSHFIMLQRNLIYTGITRAKKLLVLVGDRKAISYAIKNNKVIERNTWLKERLIGVKN